VRNVGNLSIMFLGVSECLGSIMEATSAAHR